MTMHAHHATMDLTAYFRRDLTDEMKQAILRYFGAGAGAINLESITPSFEYYRRETLASTILVPPPIKSHEGFGEIINILKTSLDLTKAAILETHSERTPGSLDLCVRTMLVTACSNGGDVFNPSWEPHETLQQFISRLYPSSPPPTNNTRHNPVSISKMAAGCLAHDTRITTHYTERSTDHLDFRVGADWKSLYLFQYPCYLRMCLEALRKDRPELNHTAEESLAL